MKEQKKSDGENNHCAYEKGEGSGDCKQKKFKKRFPYKCKNYGIRAHMAKHYTKLKEEGNTTTC